VIKRLVRDLRFDTEIVVLPIVREPSGLAMSSRNELLEGGDREAASIIYRSLSKAEEAFDNGETSAGALTQIVCGSLEGEERALPDYVALVDPDSLDPIEKVGDGPALLAAAVRFGKVRLIDNVILNAKQ